MLKWNLKEDILTVLILVIMVVLVMWFMVAQPTFTKQSSQDTVANISAENLKNHVYTIVEKFDDRIYSNIEMLDATAKYIHDEFLKYSMMLAMRLMN